MMGEQTLHVYDEFGQILEVKGICHFSMESTGKKYVFYHLNEEVQGNRIKMYVAEVGDTQGVAQPIPDDVWLTIRDYMSKLLKREPAEGVTGLPMKDSSIYCGKVKKIGVPKESIAVFAATNVIEAAENKDEPVVPAATPATEEPKTEESLDPALNKPAEPEPPKDEVQLESTPAVATVLEPVKDEELYKKVDELAATVEEMKTTVSNIPTTPDMTGVEELINKNKEEMITVMETFKQTILDMKVELDTVRDELHKHLEEHPTDDSAVKVLVNNENEQPNENIGMTVKPTEEVQSVAEQELNLEPEAAPATMEKPPVEEIVENNGVETPEASPKVQAEGTEEGIQETILVPPTNEAPKAPKEPEDTLVEKSLTAPKGPTITPISIVDAPPIEESSDVEVPELESEQTTLYEPELVTKEPSYFENAQNLSDAEKNENPLDPKDDPDVNKVLPPENPGTPLQETPYATSIHDSSTYVPFDDGADVQKNHFNEAPVTMPTGSVNPKQMAPLGGGATALTPNQLP